MKRNTIMRILAGSGFLLLLTIGCTSPYAPGRPEELQVPGSLSVAVGRELGELTASDASTGRVVTASAEDFEIILQREGSRGASTPPLVRSLASIPGEPLLFEAVVPGTWSLTAVGRAADGEVVVEGTRRGIIVESQQTVAVTLVLFHIGSPGAPADTEDVPETPATGDAMEDRESVWDDFLDTAAVVLRDDGGITYLAAGYTFEEGGTHITVGDDGSLDYGSHNRERRLYTTMPASLEDLESYRLVLNNVHFDEGSGWGIFFHGAHSTTGEHEEYNGYTLQFDVGLGDRIVLRQWVDGGHNSWGRQVRQYADRSVADYPELELKGEMDIELTVSRSVITLRIFQDGSEWTIYDALDVVESMDPSQQHPDVARTMGFVGFRAWSTTNLTIGEMILYDMEVAQY